MTVWSHLSTIFGRRQILFKLAFAMLCVVFITVQILAIPAFAAPSNQTLNFSARLKNVSGGVVADGYYNIGFKLYTGSSGGSSVWSETYHDTNGSTAGGDNRVRVVNGYFSVKLGSLEPFTGVDWDEDLWMTMNIGGTNQIANANSISWDGEMSPRIQLSAVPYAMNANAVGGKSVDKLLQLGQDTQTDSSNNTSLAINKTGTGDLINLQADGADVLTLDRSGNLTLGSSKDHSIAVGSATSGIGSNLSLQAGSTSDNQQGGTLYLQGGSSTGLANGGDVSIDAGSGSSGGNIVLGGDNASSVNIGNTTSTTKVKGSLNTNTMILGDNAEDIVGQLNFASGNDHIGTLSGSSLTANRNYSLPDESGTLCLQASEGCGFIMNDPSSAQSGSIWLSGGATFGADLHIRTGTNSTTAFMVQNASGNNLLNVNSTNNRITLGSSDTTATLLVLDTKTDEGDPTGVAGAMYYNSDRGKMRCYENDAWENCLSNTKGVPTTKTSNYTADYGDFIIANSTTNAFTISLPEPRAGAVISVKKVNAGNAINVNCLHANIDNLSTVVLSSQWVSQDFYSDGTQWYRV